MFTKPEHWRRFALIAVAAAWALVTAFCVLMPTLASDVVSALGLVTFLPTFLTAEIARVTKALLELGVGQDALGYEALNILSIYLSGMTIVIVAVLFLALGRSPDAKASGSFEKLLLASLGATVFFVIMLIFPALGVLECSKVGCELASGRRSLPAPPVATVFRGVVLFFFALGPSGALYVVVRLIFMRRYDVTETW